MQEWIRWLLAAICVLAALFMMACMLMMRQARKLVVVRRYFTGKRGGTVPRIAFISDLHIRRMPVPWSNIIATLRDEKPELVVVTGDLCNSADDANRARLFVELLAERLEVPVYITLGNHDNAIFEGYSEMRARYLQRLQSRSSLIRVLDDACDVCEGILIGGLNDVRTVREVDDPTPAELVAKWGKMAQERHCPFILATHNADMALELEDLEPELLPDLMLSGHTHGGQVRTPLNFEFHILREDILPKKGIYYGAHEWQGIPLHITSGLGCAVLPIRWGSHAEIVILGDAASEDPET